MNYLVCRNVFYHTHTSGSKDLLFLPRSLSLCGGNAEEWLTGLNELLTKEGILLNGAEFKDAYVFEHENLTNILYSFDDIAAGDLNMGRLAVWRLQTHHVFGGTWVSDYITNQLGIDLDLQRAADEKPSVLSQIRAHREAAKTAPTTTVTPRP